MPLPRSPEREAGVALIAVILVLALTMALTAALTTAVVMDTGLRGAFDRTTSGFYAAESGLNHGMGEVRNKFLSFNVPSGADFNPTTFKLGKRDITYQLEELPGNPQSVTIPSGQLFGGLKAVQYTYIVNSKAQAMGEVEADVAAEFDVSYIPLFQFIAFYVNDLEIMPGADMRLHGRVHTNGNLYLNSDARLWIEDAPASGITTVQASSKGNIYRGRKNDTTRCTGTVTVDKLEDKVAPSPDLDPKDLACDGGTKKVPVAKLAEWKGSMVSEIQSISVPEPDIIAIGAGSFWERADLRIALRLNTPGQLPGAPAFLPHSIEVLDASGNRDAALTTLLQQFMTDNAYNAANSSIPGTRPIFYTDVPTGTGACTCTNAAPNGCNNGASACYAPTIPAGGAASNARVYATNMTGDLDYRRGGFYNRREKKWMILLNVNVADLLDWNRRRPTSSRFFDPADTTDGGIVLYLTVLGPNSAGINNYGVRIFGSRNLWFPAVPSGGDPTGITVASDQAIYLLGDYNRGNTAAGDRVKQPAAVMGDSVNVLSENYFNNGACGNDCQSNRSLDDALRDAATTTINSAFLAGVDETTSGNYNGGLENYPRFHEDWGGGRQFNYRGSFVSLGTPRHVNGAWCGTGGTNASGCNIYNPPNRNFDYDPAFNDVRNLPPLTPRFVYVQQVLFTEAFK